MKLPRGFGKNYFTLSAITATVNQVSINANASRVQDFHLFNFSDDKLENEEELEELDIFCPLQLSIKPCYCNCFFLKQTLKTLKLYNNQKFFLNYYKRLNNSISPPKQILF